MEDNNLQNSLCITSMKQKLSGPTEAHGPFIPVSVCEMTKFYLLYYLFNCINPNVKIVFVNEKNRRNCNI